MKIAGITVWHVPLTSHLTDYMADGEACDTVDTAVARLETDRHLPGHAFAKPGAVLNVRDLSGYVTPRLDPKASVRQGGVISPSKGPGLGLVIDEQRLGEPVAVYN